MKKLLIVSLFLLSMIGLMAQVPHSAVFNLMTDPNNDGVGDGYHASDAVGFKVCTVMPIAFGGAEQWLDTSSMYWNWPGVEDDFALNSAPTQYYDASDPDTPGLISIQMSPFSSWGVDFGGGNIVTANFYFVDGEGNETGPYNLAKGPTSFTQYPDVIAWGGPAAPTAPDAWATLVAPVDGSGDAASDVLLEWAYAGTVDLAGFELTYRNISAATDPVTMDLAADVFEYQLTDLMMDQYTYGWTVKPFILDGETKVYPEGEVPAEWTFTTASIPVIYPDNAFNFFPADNATGVALDVELSWEYSDESPAVDGFQIDFNGEVSEVAATVFTYTPAALAYETTYTWSVTPYIVDDAGAKSYLSGVRRATVSRSSRTITRTSNATKTTRDSWLTPEVTLDPLTFTTMDEPEPDLIWATNATPANEATDVALMPTLTWTYDGPTVDGYEIWVNGVDMGDVTEGMSYTFTEALDYNTMYTWGVKPYTENTPAPLKGLKGMKTLRVVPVEDRDYPTVDTMPTTTFTTLNAYVAPEPVEVGGVMVEVAVVVTGTPAADWTPNNPQAVLEGELTNQLPNGAPAFLFGASIAQGIAGSYTFTFTTGYAEGNVYVDGALQPSGVPANGIVVVTIAFTGAKEAHEVVITEPTLPVELSSFTAVAHANEYVTLNWITESESNLQGYNVYRSETEDQDQSIRINANVISANNTTLTQNYSYTDREVENTTYYYWLQVSELSNENIFHGPIVVTVEDDAVVPGIAETTFRNFGPSPFTEATSTTLRVKEGETASVTIYNLLGQVVRRESFNAGEHNFTFNGKDLNNKTVANGIYFVRMSSPTQSKSFKIVKIK